MSAKSIYGELEIELHRTQTGFYEVMLRLTDPQSQAEVAPVRGLAAIDVAALLASQAVPEEYGRLLSAQLFADAAVRGLYGKARAALERGGLMLRVRVAVDVTAVELHGLRWELLRDPETNAPLATSERVLLSRFMASQDWRRVELRPRAQLRAVIAVSAPSDLDRHKLAAVDLDGEVARATRALAGIEVTVLGEAQALTVDRLVDAMRTGVDIVYLVCHGVLTARFEPILYLQSETGATAPVKGAALAQRLGELPVPPRLMVLASCESAGRDDASAAVAERPTAQASLAPLLANAGVPAVLAMQGKVSMETVRIAMPRFFAELLKDGQIDRALAVARGAVRGRSDHWIPALLLRLKSGQLWSEPMAPGAPIPTATQAAIAAAAGPRAHALASNQEIFTATQEIARLVVPAPAVAVIDALQDVVTPSAPDLEVGARASQTAPPAAKRSRWQAWATLLTAIGGILPAGHFICGVPREPASNGVTSEAVAGEAVAGEDEVGADLPSQGEEPPATATSCPKVPAGMVCVRGGSFEMGSTPRERDEAIAHCEDSDKCIFYIDREAPSRQTVAMFMLDAYEVSNAEFEAWLEHEEGLVVGPGAEQGLLAVKAGNDLLAEVADATVADGRASKAVVHRHILRDSSGRYAARQGFGEHPTTLVTWYGADRYCRAHDKRLPTEVEWEYGARGADRRIFPWGSEWPSAWDCDGVIFGRTDGGPCANRPRATEKRGPRVLDRTPEPEIFDLGGNVAEWVSTPFLDPDTCDPKSGTCCTSPDVPPRSGWSHCHVLRGGNWQGGAEAMRVAGRARAVNDAVRFFVGFRCARDAAP